MFHGHLSVSPAFSCKPVDIGEGSEPPRPAASWQFRVSCPRELPGVGKLRYPGLWALVGALLLQSEQLLVQSCSLYVCRNSQEPGSSGTGPSDLLRHLRLAFVLLRPTCLAPFALCTLLLLLGCPVQHLTFKLCAPANRKSAGLTFIFAVCIWLPARRCFWLCGWHWLDHGT